MSVVLVGASHHEATLDELDHLARTGDGLARALLGSGSGVRGAAVLSTCNRFEVYLDVDRLHAVETLTTLVAELTAYDHDNVADLLRVTVGGAVVQHLLAVASGLESMVMGEGEIAGQVRSALATAQREGTTSPALQRLLQRALATSKTVASTTGLGAAGRSVVTVALDVLEARYGAAAGRRAVVLGTGSYARVVIAALRARGCHDITVHSASGRAQGFARAHDVVAVTHEDLADAIAAADLVVACSGRTEAALRADLVGPRVLPLPVLDLALSSDVAPEVRARTDIDVIDLETVGQYAPGEHAAAVLAAQEIVLAAAEDFERAETGRSAAPAVVAMRDHVHGLVDEEVDRVRRRLGDQAADEVARSLTRVTNALLHTPSVRAHELAHEGAAAGYAEAMRTLFGIEVPDP